MKTFDINNTALVPHLITEQITDNIEEQYCLVERAERHYRDNEIWRKQLNRNKDQREFLFSFMEHWLKVKNK